MRLPRGGGQPILRSCLRGKFLERSWAFRQTLVTTDRSGIGLGSGLRVDVDMEQLQQCMWDEASSCLYQNSSLGTWGAEDPGTWLDSQNHGASNLSQQGDRCSTIQKPTHITPQC